MHPKDLEHLVLVESAPIEFKVEQGPQESIALTRAQHDKAIRLVDELDGDAALKIVYGRYTEKLEWFLNPESPAGSLRRLGKPAVPALIKGLENHELSDGKRAWLISIIDSIMAEETLRPATYSDIYGSYETRSLSGSSSSSGGKPSRAAQQQLIDRWVKFRDDYILLEFQDGKQ